MKLCWRKSALALIAGALVWLAAPSVRAEGCQAIRATIDLGTGSITGNFGLEGTVVFTQDSAGTPPPTAPPGSTVFSGLLAITTAGGTLSLRETGVVSSRAGNPEGPVLTSWGDGVSGAGEFAGVTGDLFFFGRRNAQGLFLVKVRGKLCRP
jgi:hypothetical protein